MKLHMSPISTTSRPVMLFCAEAGVDVTMVPVDLMAGEHHGEKFVALNPNRLVPVLEDGDFVLTESSAIL
jgi:glutathione S-transferase